MGAVIASNLSSASSTFPFHVSGFQQEQQRKRVQLRVQVQKLQHSLSLFKLIGSNNFLNFIQVIVWWLLINCSASHASGPATLSQLSPRPSQPGLRPKQSRLWPSQQRLWGLWVLESRKQLTSCCSTPSGSRILLHVFFSLLASVLAHCKRQN